MRNTFKTNNIIQEYKNKFGFSTNTDILYINDIDSWICTGSYFGYRIAQLKTNTHSSYWVQLLFDNSNLFGTDTFNFFVLKYKLNSALIIWNEQPALLLYRNSEILQKYKVLAKSEVF